MNVMNVMNKANTPVIKERKIPFIAGMMFESKTHPQFNCIVDFVWFNYDNDNKLLDYAQIVDWSITNKETFNNFCSTHCHSKDSTFPYASWGECNIKSFKQRLKKYNLEFVGMSDRETVVYENNEYEYCGGIK